MKFIKKLLHGASLILKTIPLFWQSSKLCTLLLFFAIPLQGFIPVLTVYATKNIIDLLVASSPVIQSGFSLLYIYLILWIALYIIQGILNPITMLAQGAMTDKLIALINENIMNKSISIKDLGLFENPAFYDDIQIIQEEGAWRPVNLIVFIISIFRSLITVISLLFLLMQFHPLIALIMILSLLPQSIVLYRLQEEAFENMVTKSPLSRKLKYFSTILLSKEFAKESRLFQYGNYFTKKYKDVFQTIHKDSMKIRKKQTAFASLLFIIGAIGSGIAFLWVILKTVDGRFTSGDILLFSSSIIIFGQTIITMIQESTLLYDTLLYMEKFFNFIEFPSFMKCGDEILGEKGIEHIEFHHVTFTYQDASSPALDDVSFSISSKERIALVGENGSGKSTIIKLICRLYDVDFGEIFVNGKNIKEYDIDNYRKSIGIIFQDYSKYDLTVKENIAVSDIDNILNEVKLEEAIEKAGIHQDIFESKNGYEQQLGKNFKGGIELSGGQWQKLAIARAFFRNGSLLLFDEPSSSLDAVSEEYFFNKIKDMCQDKIVLFITHKLSAATMADKIIVLKNGRIVEEGSHKSLLDAKGHYSHLFNLQAKRFI